MAGGTHVNIRLEEHKLCLLVMIGVRADGRTARYTSANVRRRATAQGGRALA